MRSRFITNPLSLENVEALDSVKKIKKYREEC